MRLFVGIEIDPAVAAAAASGSDELRRRAGRLAPLARITWTPADRLHFTVRFIGHVGEERALALHTLLEAPVRRAPFDVTVAGMGVFPTRGAPRVIWAGVGAGAEALGEIEREVTRRLAPAGVEPEERPYRPHLTLARVREAAGLRARALLNGMADRVFGTTRVGAITLFESRLSPTGPTYVALRRTPLRLD